MAKNVKFFSFDNIKISAKGLVSSLMTFVLVGIVVWFMRAFFVFNDMNAVAMLTTIIGLILWFITWGYFSSRLWGWD